MKTIRYNTFETNSSSTHSMIILTEEEEQKLDTGELYLKSVWDDTLITKEERDKIILDAISEDNFIIDPEWSQEATIEYYLQECDDRSELPVSLDQYLEYRELETNVNHYTSPSGDNLTIICQYGYDY